MSAPPPSAAAPAAIPSGARHGPAPGCAGTGDLRRAWVVFCGHADLAWLKLLAPGFRHCFVVLNDGRHWLTVDPLSCFTELEVQPVPAGFDLPAFYRARGLTVVPAPLGRARAAAAALGAVHLRRGGQARPGPARAVRADAAANCTAT